MSEQLPLFPLSEPEKGESVQLTTTVSGLTKTAFVKGAQCAKLLWFHRHEPDAPEWTPSPIDAFKIAEGERVGLAARERFPGGVLVDRKPSERRQAERETAALVAKRVPAIFEAAFSRDGVHVRVDVLELSAGGRWRIVEVKSSNEVKERHKHDVAVQWWAVTGAGIPAEGIDLMHLNPDCRHPDLSNLFVRQDMTDFCRGMERRVAEMVGAFEQVLASPLVPDIPMGRQCWMDGQACPFRRHCEGGVLPSDHVMQLYRGEGKRLGRALVGRRIFSLKDVPPEDLADPIHRRQAEAARSGGLVADRELLRRRLAEVRYPLVYLDFETIEPSIPRYPGTSPNRQVAVQFSCHILSRQGRMGHREYLCESGNPLPEFADALLEAVGEEGSIVVYYADFERSRILELAEALPDRRGRLLALVPRIWDLCEVTQQTLYHPGFMGSFSIKKTLPVLVPGDGYANLDIADGGAAMLAYATLTDPATPARKRGHLRKSLLAYCRQDTQAMVDIHRVLIGVAEQEDLSSP